jgi:hypothetical protein
VQLAGNLIPIVQNVSVTYNDISLWLTLPIAGQACYASWLNVLMLTRVTLPIEDGAESNLSVTHA